MTSTVWEYEVNGWSHSRVKWFSKTLFCCLPWKLLDQTLLNLQRFILKHIPSDHYILRVWDQRSRSQQAQMTLKTLFCYLSLKGFVPNFAIPSYRFIREQVPIHHYSLFEVRGHKPSQIFLVKCGEISWMTGYRTSFEEVNMIYKIVTPHSLWSYKQKS